jgi:hypothetical protein
VKSKSKDTKSKDTKPKDTKPKKISMELRLSQLGVKTEDIADRVDDLREEFDDFMSEVRSLINDLAGGEPLDSQSQVQPEGIQGQIRLDVQPSGSNPTAPIT